MVKRFVFYFLILFSVLSCATASKEQKFKQLIDSIEDPSSVYTDEGLSSTVMNKIDALIQNYPNYWDPYRYKISLIKMKETNKYLTGDIDIDGYKKLLAVYSQWIENSNELNDYQKYSYNVLLVLSGNTLVGNNGLNELWESVREKKVSYSSQNEEGKFVLGYYAGYILNIFTSSSFAEYLDLFLEKRELFDFLENEFNSLDSDEFARSRYVLQ